ncbi:hypothetical protein [Bacillus piscicola]|uniref:hypothetical protein n=1 Tax=Bacillus piscicola TaxID=1632684 RepID=UPI001F094C5F|nr:hypothetical protein [Bacillus piscicola]
MNENKPYVELLLSSSNPHISFLTLSETIIHQPCSDEDAKQNALQKVVDAYEEICRDQPYQYKRAVSS